MILFNDAQASINPSGNLTLGGAGADDGQGDASQPYAKKDFWASFSPLRLPLGIPVTSLTEANVRTSVGLYSRSYTAGGAITPNIVIPLSELIPLHRKLAAVGTLAAPHGFKLLDLILSYTIATAGATSIAVVFSTEATQANAGARALASATPLGAVTYENPLGTVAATLPVATQATPYVCRIVPAAPVFVNTDRQTLTAELQLSLPNTCVLAITEIAAHFSVALQ